MVESGERYSTPVINRSHVTLTTCHYPDIAKKMTGESNAKKSEKKAKKVLTSPVLYGIIGYNLMREMHGLRF